MRCRSFPSLSTCAALAVSMTVAHAQEAYPTRAVRLIVPSAPGGGTDTSARLIAPRLAALLGQQVVVDNRAGAAAMLGTESVARATPDGYTLLMGLSTMTIVPSTYKKVPFDPVKDFAPISMVVVVPQLLVGHLSLPAKNVKELIALAKAHPGQLDYAAGGYGANPHMSMALFLMMTGTNMTYVPYKTGNAGLMDALAGRVPLMMSNLLVALPHVKTGRFRAYGVTSGKRASGVPDLPTLAEGGVPGYEAVQWFGVLAPAATPREIVMRLHRDLIQVMQDEETRKRFIADGGEPAYSKSPEEFSALIRSERVKWAKVAKAAKIEPM
jgi:tripartite-type tricarboxylate transporter receptor subunit TctC